MENIIQTGLKIFKPNTYLNHNIYNVYETEKIQMLSNVLIAVLEAIIMTSNQVIKGLQLFFKLYLWTKCDPPRDFRE